MLAGHSMAPMNILHVAILELGVKTGMDGRIMTFIYPNPYFLLNYKHALAHDR
jgi:hypothetical protein